MKEEKSFKEDLLKYLANYTIPTILRYILFGIIVFITMLLIEVRYIPSESMYPTLKKNDMVIVSKIPDIKQNFKRGDIVTILTTDNMIRLYDGYKNPVSLPFLKVNPIFIKRLIAIEGDTFEVKNGLVYVNGKQLKEPYLNEHPDYTINKIKVPKGKCVILGDNRNNSLDSSCYGFVPMKNLRGVAIFRILPFSRFGPL